MSFSKAHVEALTPIRMLVQQVAQIGSGFVRCGNCQEHGNEPEGRNGKHHYAQCPPNQEWFNGHHCSLSKKKSRAGSRSLDHTATCDDDTMIR